MPGSPPLLSDLIAEPSSRRTNHGFGHGQKGAIGFLVVEP